MTELRATLRLQFHAGFTLDDAVPLLDHFAALGVSHLYASPLLTAQPGSSHGYDVVDPTRINPELGGEPALRRLVAGLRERGMGLIVDLVSNHMGIGAANPWWQDVLEWGRASPYASFFDIHWHSADPLLRDQVLLPCLPDDYGEVLAGGAIGVHFDHRRGRFHVSLGALRFPLCPDSYDLLLNHGEDAELRRLAQRFAGLAGNPQAREAAAALCEELAALLDEARLDAVLRPYRVAEGAHWWPLHQLLEIQHYRLANWRTAADDLNWRRFFDINELVGLRAERGDVFEASHGCLFRLIGEGLIDGLRIDHIDGLADPRHYCRRLRRRCDALAGRHLPIHVEKILGPGERLAGDWLVDGSTGYEFMNQMALLQHDPLGELPLAGLWRRVSGRGERFADEIREARELMLQTSLAGDLESVAQGLLQIARADIFSRDLPLGAIRRALFQLIAAFLVYRTYAGVLGRSAEDQRWFDEARREAEAHLGEADRRVLDWLDRWLGGEPLRDLPPGQLRRLRWRILARFQQLTSPAAAKAVEDTAFYRSAVSLARNEVGFDPQRFSAPAEAFHQACAERRESFPDTLLAGATHDHKRGEDSRARLAVLSERAGWFAEALDSWRELAAPLRRMIDGQHAPSGGDEAILYQCLLGAWPMDLAPDDAPGLDAFHQRIAQWQRKALREARLRSDWSAPDEPYENACAAFVHALLLDAAGLPLRRALAEAANSLMPAGALNSLAQALLRYSVPGVPDLYQGCDFWDFSLVDPDNRRQPDFAARSRALQEGEPMPALLAAWRDGRIKQALIARALGLRKRHPALFREGDYQPLQLRGEQAGRLLAFARSHAGRSLLVVVPRLAAGLLGDQPLPQVPAQRWGDTELLLPAALAGRRFAGLFAGEEVQDEDGRLPIAEVLRNFPVNLLFSSE
ncbi:Maltooligosyl trehalose synthase [compost metagenome]